MMRTRVWFFGIGAAGLLVAIAITASHGPVWASEDKPADYQTWGEDHVGQELPEYTTGTECLFCHRDYVAPRWKSNPHNRTMRFPEPDDPALKALADSTDGKAIVGEVQILLGSKEHVRYLKRLEAYGQAAMSGQLWNGTEKQIRHAQPPGWHQDTFGPQCAGCHATAIDTETISFGSPSLDCYVCHGILELEHANDNTQTLFSPEHADDPRVVISVCGQCHLRGGKSRATGRPYPTLFVPGDNLFRDFDVDWSDDTIARMDMIDKHIFENARAVMVAGSKTTCTSCHSVHGESTKKHQELEQDQSCETCHRPGKEMTDVDLPKNRSSRTCEYP
jgi:hypothetical protein